jgi:diguanylate cyclase (GGDEF)-like protein
VNRRSGNLVGCVCAAWALAAPLQALDPGRAITQYVQNVWRAPGALPHDNITTILQTRDGYLWIGTVEGLARFDGVRSVVFDKSNTPALANNWIRALVEDRAGRLWIGTLGGGLVCLESGKFTRFGATEGIPGEIVSALYSDRAGRLWAGSGEGLFLFRAGRFVRAPGSEALATRSVRSLVEDSAGTLWVGTESGLFRFFDGTARALPSAMGLSSDAILALAADGSGLWIGTAGGGLKHLAAGTVTTYAGSEGLPHERVWSLAFDRDGNLWIGTDGGGLARLRQGALTTFDTRNGLTNDFVWALHEDREGSLWVGTNGGGLNRLKNGAVQAWTTREGLPGDFVWSVVRDRAGSLWVGTEDAGVARIRQDGITRFGAAEGFAGSARALLERADGSLWIAGDRGLFVFKGERARPIPLAGHADDILQALAEDTSGTLWIGTVSDGLLALADGRLRTFTTADSLLNDSITALSSVADGTLWVGTIGGINRREPDGRWSSLTTSDGLPGNYVTALFEGGQGDLWAATRGGLARIRNGRVASLTAAHGLFDDALMSALPGDDGWIWMGSNRGIFASPLAEIEELFAGRRTRVSSRSYGLEDGLRSVEVNHSGTSSLKDPDGRLWFATRVGVAMIAPAQEARNPLPPPVRIEEVVADGRTLPAQGPWRLPAGTRRLDFHYTALSFASVPGTVLRHRLEGFDPDWVAAEPDRTISYTSLPHGRYRFRVIAANSDGVWNHEGASVDFEIEPRFHETIWFRAGAVLVFVILGPLFYYARVHALRRRQAELERLVAERTAEVGAANARLEQLAREDSLTGVANRRMLDETLDEEWRRAIRQGSPLAMLLIDVDLFKAFNDRQGHPEGDACLKAIASSVAETCRRAGEFVARYGGEEFAVLLPGASRATALATAEKVRASAEALGLLHPASTVAPVVTVSVGVAWIAPGSGGTAAGLLYAADRALYRAKQNGRNRVESADFD